MNRHPGLASILINGSWQSSMVIYTFIIRLLYVLVLSVLLGPELYGFFAYAQTFYLTFIPLVVLGLGNILPREIGANGKAAKPQLDATLSVRLTLGIVFCVLAIVIGFAVEDSVEHQWLIALVALTLIPRSFQEWTGAVMLGFEASRSEALRNIMFRTLEVVAGISALYFFDAGLWTLIVIHLLCWTGYAFSCLQYIHRNLITLNYRFRWSDFSELMGENVNLAVQMFASVALLNIPLLLYKHTVNDLALFGQFALAFQATMIAAQSLQALNVGASPVMARSMKRRDGKDIKYVIGMTGLLGLLGCVMAQIIQLYAQPVVMLALGEDYANTGLYLEAFAWMIPFMTMIAPSLAFLVVRKQVWTLCLVRMAALLLMGGAIAWLGLYSASALIDSYYIAMGATLLMMWSSFAFYLAKARLPSKRDKL